MNDTMPSADDWALYRRAYRRSQRMDARASLRAFYRRHPRCSFEINGRSMAGIEVADRVGAASDETLRTFHRAAEQHKRGKR